jgi:hypothetical protein
MRLPVHASKCDRPPIAGWCATPRHPSPYDKRVATTEEAADMIQPPRHGISTDLVEYLVLVVPGLNAVATIADELTRVVAGSAIRILDMVVVSFDDDGTLTVTESETIESLAALHDSSSVGGVLLSRHDIEMVALTLRPPNAAIIVVVEDRWAESLSSAARSAGGEVRAGERIARQRVELALARATEIKEDS